MKTQPYPKNESIRLRMRLKFIALFLLTVLAVTAAQAQCSIQNVTHITPSRYWPIIEGCPITLTAEGPSATTVMSGGFQYQWGTGTVPGENILTGLNSRTITVSPSVSITRYWVRLVKSGCTTSAVSYAIQVSPSSTAPLYISYTNNGCSEWGLTLTAVGGETATDGRYQWGTGSVPGQNVIANQFNNSIWIDPTANTVYWVRRYDPSCDRYTDAVFTTVYKKNTTTIGAPSAITQNGTIGCASNTATLSITTNGMIQWGTGTTAGSNIIASGNNLKSITISPTTTTTYWVRVLGNGNTGCPSAPVFHTVNVSQVGVPGTISTPSTTACYNALISSPITLSGHQGTVLGWEKAANAAFNSQLVSIAHTGTSLSPEQLGPIQNSVYVRVKIAANCGTIYTAPILIQLAPTAVYQNGNLSQTLNANTALVVRSNMTLNSDVTACSCTVENGATLTVATNRTLTVVDRVSVQSGANLIIEDSGSLLQLNNDARNEGNVTVYRNSSRMAAFDYTYWASPVRDWTLYQMSPNTLSNKYFSFSPEINNWVIINNGAQVMRPGVGYIVRAPQGWSQTNATNGVFTAQFKGVPNNGTIPVEVKKGATKDNLVGNPYPSGVNADLFITENYNKGLMNGTLYFWTHNTPLQEIAGIYVYNSNDYNKYNLTGGVRTASTHITGKPAPDGTIASGQGFFVELNESLVNGTYALEFNNSMRLMGKNSSFYRQSLENEVEKHRIWLTLTNPLGAYDETLLGYVSGATDAIDGLYDGSTYDGGNPVSIYTLIDDKTLSIQGRALPFQEFDVIPLGYKVNNAGRFTISLDRFDGLFQDQSVYLRDKLTQEVYSLKDQSFEFETASGVYNDRFEILYRHPNLSTQNFDRNDQVIAVQNNGRIEIHSNLSDIQNIELYDITGKKLRDYAAVDTRLFQTETLHFEHQVLLVKVTLENGASFTKKIFF